MVASKEVSLMKTLILATIMSLMCNCIDEVMIDDELSIKRTEFTGTHLRIDGYYFEKYPVNSGGNRYNIYFFYKNGIVLYGESPSDAELTQMENDYKSGNYYGRVKSHKYYWGVFKVEGSAIQFERWYPSDPPLKAYIRSGTILNDTTFQITKSTRTNGSDVEKENEIYHFKQFSPKPDSANSFIP